jgi:hypothetical protein
MLIFKLAYRFSIFYGKKLDKAQLLEIKDN